MIRAIACGLLFAIAGLASAAPWDTQAADVNLSWVLPTTRTNGAPLGPTDLVFTRVYEVSDPAKPVLVAEVKYPGTTCAVKGVAVPGAYAYAVVVYDSSGLFSALSNVSTRAFYPPSPASLSSTVTINVLMPVVK